MAWLLWVCGVVWAGSGLPLQSVSFHVQVDGPLAEIIVEQTYVNPHRYAIEGVYVFPLHEQAAVDGMRFEVGDRLVEGRIDRRERAEDAYDLAMTQGQTAALTIQSRPNLFEQRIGNIPAKETVRVWLRVVQPVPHVDGAYELTLPLRVGPRFERVDDAAAEPGPPVLQPGADVRAAIDVRVRHAMPLTRVQSPSHAIDTQFEEGGYETATEVPLDRDFVLRWDVEADRPQAGVIVQDGYLLLTFEPPDAPPRDQVVPRELVWVLDQSGSMNGEPITIVKQAMQRALDFVDERDRIRILSFADEVRGDDRSLIAKPNVVAAARERIAGLEADGGTFLVEGLTEALAPAADPTRERTVLFLTDGLIGGDFEVLSHLDEHLGDSRLFTFGVGESPHRWLLQEMAYLGGGKATWLRPGESSEAAIERFVDTMSRPVLTNLVVDWGDWEVQDVWPLRPKALYAGQPTYLAARIVTPGTTPIVVEGQLGDGPYRRVLMPMTADSGRAIPSTWARQTIGALERGRLRGPNDELVETIIALSLKMQVLSHHTAFIAIDESQSVLPQRTIDADNVAIEFKTKHVGVGGNPSAGGAAVNANGYLLDGVDMTDPRVGTFGVNFDFTSLTPDPHRDVGPMPEVSPGPSDPRREPFVNTPKLNLGASQVASPQGAPVRATTIDARASGPLVRDRLWGVGSYRFDATANRDRRFRGHAGRLSFTTQTPGEGHRISATGALHLASIHEGETTRRQANGLAHARWQAFLGADADVDTLALVQRTAVGGDRRRRERIVTRGQYHDVWGPLGRRHHFRIGADVERVHWRLGNGGQRAFAPDLPRDPTVWRSGFFVQDRLELGPPVRLEGGVRADLAFGRTHLGPRGWLTWTPGRGDRAQLTLGGGRRFGGAGLVQSFGRPDRGLSHIDEAIALAEVPVFEDLVVGASGTRRRRRGVPTLDGARGNRDVWQVSAFLRKLQARRWHFAARWDRTWADDDTGRTFIDDSDLEGFAHRVHGALAWALPLDPYTLTVGLEGDLYADSLGTIAPDPTQTGLPNAARWVTGLTLRQRFPLRRGRLIVELAGRYVAPRDNRELAPLLGLEPALLPFDGWEGLRAQAGVRLVL